MSDEIPKARPIWQELPAHFKINAIKMLDYQSRCNLRLTSRADKEVIDKTKIRIFVIKLQCERDFQIKTRIKMEKDSTEIEFSRDFFDFSKPLLKILRNPNIKIRQLNLESILIPEILLALVREKMTNIKIETLNVNQLLRYDHQDFVKESFLELLDRFNLKKMVLGGKCTPKSFEKLTATKQWKEAEGMYFINENDFEIRHFLHFNSLTLSRTRIEPEEAKALIQTFVNKKSFAHTSTFFEIYVKESMHTHEILPTSDDSLKENVSSRLENHDNKVRVKKFELVNSDSLVLLVKATHNTLKGVVCRKSQHMFDDFKGTLRI